MPQTPSHSRLGTYTDNTVRQRTWRALGCFLFGQLFVADEQGTFIARLLHGHYHIRLFTDGDQISGDLFLSIDRIRDNAKSPIHALFFNELIRVIAHGHLHLLGYKDKVKSDQAEMRLQEERWIAAFEPYDA